LQYLASEDGRVHSLFAANGQLRFVHPLGSAVLGSFAVTSAAGSATGGGGGSGSAAGGATGRPRIVIGRGDDLVSVLEDSGPTSIGGSGSGSGSGGSVTLVAQYVARGSVVSGLALGAHGSVLVPTWGGGLERLAPPAVAVLELDVDLAVAVAGAAAEPGVALAVQPRVVAVPVGEPGSDVPLTFTVTAYIVDCTAVDQSVVYPGADTVACPTVAGAITAGDTAVTDSGM
jgi:hypothetical protein